MSCPRCEAIGAAERDPLAPLPTEPCTCAGAEMVEISHYRPDALRRRPQRATRTTQEVSGVFAYLTSPMIAGSKDAHGAWSPAICTRDERADAHVERVTMLAYDVDECREGDIERSAAAVARYLAVVHTTFSATREQPRHRVVFALSRSLTPAEHRVAWPHVARVLALNGVCVDSVCRDVARIYFAPVVRPGGAWRARVLRGRPLDVDRTLTAAQRSVPVPKRVAPVAHRTAHGGDYAHRALASAIHAVATAPEGARNLALNRQTYAVARLAELSDREIADAMTAAARRAGLDENETNRTIASALRARGRGTP